MIRKADTCLICGAPATYGVRRDAVPGVETDRATLCDDHGTQASLTGHAAIDTGDAAYFELTRLEPTR